MLRTDTFAPPGAVVLVQKDFELFDIQPFVDRLAYIADKFLHSIQHSGFRIGIIYVVGVR